MVEDDSSQVSTTNGEEEKRRAELQELYREELRKTYQAKANGVTTYYILAQQQFHQAQYQNALYLINKALAIKETPDVLALKGSIFLALGSKEKFTENWRKALEMDANIPIPTLPFITRELQNQGLVDANFKRNF
jgi:tetratricopeptide (TPR) repeat protein